MPNLDLIQTYIMVIEKQSFSQAALQLNISKALVSMRIKRLEQEIGVSLLIRNTRKLTLTEAGHELYLQFKDLLLNITQSIENIRQGQQSASGILRMTSTYEFGHQILWELLAEFCQQHQALHLQCLFDAKPYDLIREQIDVAIRLGQLHDSTYKARKLAEYDIVLVASKSYANQMQFEHIKQLEQADWISNLNLNTIQFWNFKKGTEQLTLHEKTKYAANNVQTMKQMLLANLGVAILPKWLIEQELQQHSLVQLFSQYQLGRQGIYAVFPNQSYVPTKTRLMIDFLAAQLPALLNQNRSKT